jgi:hypothetical protein
VTVQPLEEAQWTTSTSTICSRTRAWRLLRADTSPLVLTVLGRVFVLDNVRSMAESDLVARLDEELYAINSARADDGDPPAYPRRARDYLETWAAPEQG